MELEEQQTKTKRETPTHETKPPVIKQKELDDQQIKEQYDLHILGNRNDRI